MDRIAQRLQALAAAEAMLGDALRAELAAAMLELYLVGRIDVTFDERGEPTAHLLEHPVPLVQTPLFAPPSLLPMSPDTIEDKEERKRQIGFKVN
ncbi:MAG: hypothetical protein CL398_09360 [Acidiferrobacteraceae bacterium]|nr:hypothetical protein [Acidiferrobacteraceae bacterium]|tara:strand:- start:1855 stop:2139 length:285 start_codon:yes stop_codon:yes gene_type:complete